MITNASEAAIVTPEDNGTSMDDSMAKETDGLKEPSTHIESIPTPAVTPGENDVSKQADATSATDQMMVSNTPNPRNLPLRSPTSDSIKSGPLPTIEECLFGIPRDITNKSDDEEDEKAKFFVPLSLLRRVASQGIDDGDEQLGGCHRGLAWRILLGFLPPDRREWMTVAEQQRQSYHTFVQELFCIEDRDIDGKELRGHHSKRHRTKFDKDAYKKERKERRDERRRCKEGSNNSLSGSSHREMDDQHPTNQRAPVKFLDESDNDGEPPINTSGSEESSSTDDAPTNEATTNDTTAAESTLRPALKTEDQKLSSSDLLQDDPSHWNMSVREQKILVRLTNFDAVNQLLVKRNCRDWNNFLENATLLDEIRKDVNRTHPHLYFYLEPQNRLGARRYGALERILFVWAKLNKGVRYVQGMNEIVGTLYYVLANDFNDEWADHAEADTYILFNIIMSETRDIYVSDLDNADTGIVGRIDNMQNLLKLHDPTVKSHLDNLGIEASFYAVRWLTTLLSREFLLPDTIRLWDSMFASTHKENFLRYVCVAMVLKIRDELLLADFATALQLLQKYPTCNMDELLDNSRALWIYESQITMACVKGGLTLHQALQAIPPPDKVIMAFGLRGGVALSSREQLEQASANAKEAVKNNVERARQGMQTLSSASQGLIGGARKFLRGRIRAHSSGETGEEEFDGRIPEMPQRGMFRNFSFGGRAGSEESSELGNGNDQAPDIPAVVSDAETV